MNLKLTNKKKQRFNDFNNRTNIVKDEEGDLVTDSQHILVVSEPFLSAI